MPIPSHAPSHADIVPVPRFQPAVAPAQSAHAGSPALHLQHRLHRELVVPSAADDRFSLPVRAGIMVGSSALLWAAIIAAGRVVLG